MRHEKGIPMSSRRQALALAGALTLTVFTAVAAIAGMSHGHTSKPAAPVLATQVTPASSPQRWDD
jgi:hypothetical protein